MYGNEVLCDAASDGSRSGDGLFGAVAVAAVAGRSCRLFD